MEPLALIKKYYPEDSLIYRILVKHSRLVADKALDLARKHPELNLDLQFIEEAAMLHDIGIFLCHAPGIACEGDEPYIRHGILGAGILRKEGLPRHALVCERHTGSGISREQIIRENLPLPVLDMLPVSNEEKLICFADKFFSKSHPDKEKSIEKIRKSMAHFGTDSIARFEEMCTLFL
ncbi:MAG: HD domain-containing protein [Bacteroidales bacterium]